MIDQPQSAAAPGASKPHVLSRWIAALAAHPDFANPWQFVVLFAVGTFLLLYGLIPIFGGDQLGLVGAD